jgi:hypothetical protein
MTCIVYIQASKRASLVPERQVLSSSNQPARYPSATLWKAAPFSGCRVPQCQNPSHSQPLKRLLVSGPRWSVLEALRHYLMSGSSAPGPGGRHVVSSIPQTWSGCGRLVPHDSCRRRRFPSARHGELSAATSAMRTVSRAWKCEAIRSDVRSE